MVMDGLCWMEIYIYIYPRLLKSWLNFAGIEGHSKTPTSIYSKLMVYYVIIKFHEIYTTLHFKHITVTHCDL